jgi:hypothetical protein
MHRQKAFRRGQAQLVGVPAGGRCHRLREQQMQSIKAVWIRSRISQFSEHWGNKLRFSQPLQGLLTRYPMSKSNLCLEGDLRVKGFMGVFAFVQSARLSEGQPQPVGQVPSTFWRRQAGARFFESLKYPEFFSYKPVSRLSYRKA